MVEFSPCDECILRSFEDCPLLPMGRTRAAVLAEINALPAVWKHGGDYDIIDAFGLRAVRWKFLTAVRHCPIFDEGMEAAVLEW